MTNTNQEVHDEEIVDQFTRQAVPFTKVPGHMVSIQTLVGLSGVTNNDTVLDVACGPGLVACEFARIASHVTGIDITEKMIDLARTHQEELGLSNLSWKIGNVSPLPYADESFNAVITRYSFHHFLDPRAVLSEMIRVCINNGTILIADVALPADKVDAYNQVEKLRDPSHTRALSYEEWNKLMMDSGLKNLQRSSYKLEMELEKLLGSCFPNPGDDKKIRDTIKNDIGVNSLGIDAYRSGSEIHFSFPISIFVGNK